MSEKSIEEQIAELMYVDPARALADDCGTARSCFDLVWTEHTGPRRQRSHSSGNDGCGRTHQPRDAWRDPYAGLAAEPPKDTLDNNGRKRK